MRPAQNKSYIEPFFALGRSPNDARICGNMVIMITVTARRRLAIQTFLHGNRITAGLWFLVKKKYIAI